MHSSTPARTLALIPARGGSKGLPRKNIVDLGGFPLLAWSILAAQAATGIDRIVVSTDDDEIASVATEFDCDEIIKRPPALSGDTSLLEHVIEHALEELRDEEGNRFERVLLLLPTHPFRTPSLISEAIALCDSTTRHIITVRPFYWEPHWWFGEEERGWSVIETPWRGPAAHRINLVNCTLYSTQHSGSPSGFTRELKVWDPSMWVDIDSEEDLRHARDLIERDTPPWTPTRGEWRITSEGCVRETSRTLSISPVNSSGERDLTARCTVERSGLSNPSELRAEFDKNSTLRGLPVEFSHVDVELSSRGISSPTLLLDPRKQFLNWCTREGLPLEIPGWIEFDQVQGIWRNMRTDSPIYGRQQLPEIYEWGGWGYLPAEVEENARWQILEKR